MKVTENSGLDLEPVILFFIKTNCQQCIDN